MTVSRIDCEHYTTVADSAACCPACVHEWPDGNIGLFCPTCGLVVLHGTLDSWRSPTGRNYRKAAA